MIEDPPLLTVRRSFPRPDDETVAALAAAPTTFLIDAMGGRGALHHAIKPLPEARGAMARCAGVALTCWCGPDDNLALFAAVDAAAAGDVIICATDGFCGSAVTGDLLLGMAKNKGVGGFVTDGAVRDVGDILEIGLPVFCAAVTPNSPVRNGPGRVGLPVTLGGVNVAPGDIVVADREGVVVVPQAHAAAVVAALEAVKAAEAEFSAKVKDGLSVPDFIRTLLDSDRVRYLD
jgi:4-hydroxy-4-methyl-2-oxoglutarate aldolase